VFRRHHLATGQSCGLVRVARTPLQVAHGGAELVPPTATGQSLLAMHPLEHGDATDVLVRGQLEGGVLRSADFSAYPWGGSGSELNWDQHATLRRWVIEPVSLESRCERVARDKPQQGERRRRPAGKTPTCVDYRSFKIIGRCGVYLLTK
jgi:hypothetical protein